MHGVEILISESSRFAVDITTPLGAPLQFDAESILCLVKCLTSQHSRANTISKRIHYSGHCRGTWPRLANSMFAHVRTLNSCWYWRITWLGRTMAVDHVDRNVSLSEVTGGHQFIWHSIFGVFNIVNILRLQILDPPPRVFHNFADLADLQQHNNILALVLCSLQRR